MLQLSYEFEDLEFILFFLFFFFYNCLSIVLRGLGLICIYKSRNIVLANFSQDVIISFNSPPFHVLETKMIPDIIKNSEKIENYSKELE